MVTIRWMETAAANIYNFILLANCLVVQYYHKMVTIRGMETEPANL
jgi:hypothetical protein